MARHASYADLGTHTLRSSSPSSSSPSSSTTTATTTNTPISTNDP